MGAPSTPILADGSSFAGFTGAVWQVPDSMGVSGGVFVGSGAGRQADAAWTPPFPVTGSLECFMTLANGVANGSDSYVVLASALINAHRYSLGFQSFQDYTVRRSDDDFTSSVIASGTHATSAGDQICIQKIDSSINCWHYTAGAWTLFDSVVDSTYNDMAYIGMFTFDVVDVYSNFGGGVPVITQPFVTPIPMLGGAATW